MMKTEILEYGELIPRFTLRKKSYDLGNKKATQYEICQDNFPVFIYPTKPISFEKFIKSSTCVTSWTYEASNATKDFRFIPRIGAEIFKSILESGWSVKNINEKKRYDELDQAIYLFNLAGLLIEKTEEVTLSK